VPCGQNLVGGPHAESLWRQDEASWKLRFHAQTAGCSLQDTQPEVNLIRVGTRARRVLAGCQSLHTNSLDETLALPSVHAATLALRTQQVPPTNGVPSRQIRSGQLPVESLTAQMAARLRLFLPIASRVACWQPSSRILRREMPSGVRVSKGGRKPQRIIVGVNAFEEVDGPSPELLVTDDRLNRTDSPPLSNSARSQQRRGSVFAGTIKENCRTW